MRGLPVEGIQRKTQLLALNTEYIFPFLRFMPRSLLPLHRLFQIMLLLAAISRVLDAQGQSDSLPNLPHLLNQYHQQTLQEKLFLHLDRPSYVSGEIIWFKVYAVDGTYSKPLPLSKVAYVEVINKESRSILHEKVVLRDAVGSGSIQLPTTLNSGTYTVRAYTSWMKNFDPAYYFQQSVTIVNTFRGTAIVSALDTMAYDVQFFPEGGHLVKGLVSKVAFKILDKYGTSQAAKGQLLDEQGRPVTSFQTLKFGLGSFTYTPAVTAPVYQAIFTLPTGQTITRRLPAAQEKGYVLHLEEASADQLYLDVQAIGMPANEPVLLLSHTRQGPAAGQYAQLQNGQARFVIARGKLPAGITHFTLFNAQRRPLCERLYFRQPQHRLTISAATGKPAYARRDKVTMRLQTTTANGNATPANLSVAVYRLDSLNQEADLDISSYLWLVADLKGYVESPAYYLSANGAEAATATDNLMLTHGWSRFQWDAIINRQPLALPFLPEVNGSLLQGRVTQNANGRPAPGITTYLASPGRLVRMYNSVSDNQGRILFELNNFYGLHDIVLQTNPQQDSTYHLEVLNPFSERYAEIIASPPLMFPSSFRADLAQHHLQTQIQTSYYRRQNNVYRVPATDSIAFFGEADEVYKLDDYTRFKTLEEVLREYVPGVKVRIKKDGFHLTVLDNTNRTIFTEAPLLLLDGVPIFDSNKIMAIDPLKIKKLEVLANRYFQGRTIYDGIISFTTYQGKLDGLRLDPRMLIQEYEGVQLQREFYAPRYDSPESRQSRLPDLRSLLYWNPSVTTSTLPGVLSFFTSDQPGRYRVVVQGLAATGAAGSTSFTFEVQPAL